MRNEDFIAIQPAAGFLAGLKPEPVLTVSEWADLHRRLSSKSSAEPGRWRTARTPYLREIMDMLSANNPVQEVVFEKAAQVGGTEAGNNWLGYIIDNVPAPTLMVMPTDATVKTNSKTRIDPMIEATPRLREKVAPARARDSGNTTFSKDFPGGVLMLRGANSAVGLRSMPVRNLMLDEVDGYPLDLDGEGSPVGLAEARTRTFSRRKVFKISTPTVAGISVIDAEFETTDKRYFFIPCPACGTYQRLEFTNLKWEPGKTATARYKCPHCEELISERFKGSMLAAGVWQATAPENASAIRVGYHLNSLYSPWQTWAEIADMWEKAQGHPDKLKSFVNTVLGETWKAQGDAPEWQRLFDRREEYNPSVIPQKVAFITCGVDVQKNRLEAEVVGWCVGLETYSLGYFVILGDTAETPVWDELAAVLARKWVRPDGQEMGVRMTCVDSGFNTMAVYKFVRRYPADKMAAIKGNESLMVGVSSPRAVQSKLSGKRAGWSRLWQVGVNVLKSELYGWLKLERNEDETVPPGYCHFPADYDSHYFKMLTAEQLQYTRNARGFNKYVWVKKYDRNEALDVRVYARAAALMVGSDRLTPGQWAALAPTVAPYAPVAHTAPASAETQAVTVSSPIAPAPAPVAAPVKPAAPVKKPGGFLGRHSNFKL